LTRSAEALRVREIVVSPESTNSFALTRNKRERRVRADSVTEFFEGTIDAILSQGWRERARIKKDIEVLGKPLN
jgi:hypothetical protein